jgi:hypothetical protein
MTTIEFDVPTQAFPIRIRVRALTGRRAAAQLHAVLRAMGLEYWALAHRIRSSTPGVALYNE